MFEIEQKFRLTAPEQFLETLSFMGVRWEKKVVETDTYFQHPSRDFVQTDEALRIRRHLTFHGTKAGSVPERVEAEAFMTFKGPRLDASVKIRRELELPLTVSQELPPERFAGISILPDATGFSDSSSLSDATVGFSRPQKLWRALDTLEETSVSFQWREMLELLGFRAVHDVRKIRTKAYWEWEGSRVEFSFDRLASGGAYAELEFLASDESEIALVRSRLQTLSDFLHLTDVEPRSYLALTIEAERKG